MTNETPQARPRGGYVRAGFAGAYLMISQNITPDLVGYCVKNYPILSEASWFQIVVLALGWFGSMMVLFTPSHFVDGVTDAIVFCREAVRKWRQAADQPWKE